MNAPGDKSECLHCRQLRRIKSRGLCYHCWSFPAVRGRYPTLKLGPKERENCLPCLSCQQKRPTHSRGVCWACSHKIDVRNKYASNPSFKRGVSGDNTVPRPCAPTRAMPGTEEKIQALEERAALGLSLWHREDARDAD